MTFRANADPAKIFIGFQIGLEMALFSKSILRVLHF